MAFGTNSKIFTAFVTDMMNKTTDADLNSGTPTLALFNDTITAPDQTVASASTAYGAGVWLASPEEEDTTEWPAGGQALGSVTSQFATNVYTFDAANEVSDGTSATLSDVRGCLIYDTAAAAPVVNQGICFLSFGGANSVTDGTFTVAFGAAIFTLTV
jgi:hypothetical protein